ncbi:MAG: cell division protein FtsQ/DivIB [Actinomycetota bacterium]
MKPKIRIPLRLPRPALLLSIAILVGAAYLLGWSKIFVVESIVIETKNTEVAQELQAKLLESPAVVKIGDPLARVDRRAIASRLREMLWVENITLNRKLWSGEVSIEVIPRDPIGRLTPSSSATVDSVGFLGADLEVFYLPRSAVTNAIATGETNWGKIPEISFQGEFQGDPRETNRQIREEIRALIAALSDKGYRALQINAKSPAEISSAISKDNKRLDIYWGSVNELPLKIEVLERLLELKENKRASYFNLSNPVSPIAK